MIWPRPRKTPEEHRGSTRERGEGAHVGFRDPGGCTWTRVTVSRCWRALSSRFPTALLICSTFIAGSTAWFDSVWIRNGSASPVSACEEAAALAHEHVAHGCVSLAVHRRVAVQSVRSRPYPRSQHSMSLLPNNSLVPPMSQTNNPNAAVSTERLFSANPRKVFAAFEQPDRLAQWWGPSGFTNTFEQFEFKPGGRWVFVMHGPNGANYPNESVFREIQPDTRS